MSKKKSKAGSKSPIARIDEKIFLAERATAGWIFLAMSAVVFVDVVHRVFSRGPGRVAEILSGFTGSTPEQLDALLAPALTGFITWALAYGALRTREASLKKRRRTALQTAAIALGVTIGAALVVGAFTRFIPQGVVWAPYFGLCSLLWVGLLGASMAAHQGSHLALEMGEKIWPKGARPIVKSVSQIVTALFCLMIAWLGGMSVMDHYQDWTSAAGAGLIPSIDWPKWIVFLVIPYSFGMIALRFAARGIGWLEQSPAGSELPIGLVAPVEAKGERS